MLNPLIWGGVMAPAGYQEAETVNQPLMAAQQMNEAPWRASKAVKAHHTTTVPVLYV